jgi:phosphotriesterase-related protein
MPVVTVFGPIPADSIGITLAHEHLLIDLRNQFGEFVDPERRRVSRQKLCLANSGIVRRNPYAIKDNLLLDNLSLAAKELREFKRVGGGTVVDCTSMGIGRYPTRLRELSLRTDLNIVAGCGYYTQDTHPAALRYWTAERLADEMVRDLAQGIGRTGVRAGVIGEIGTSHPIHPDERKVLLAAAKAFRQTGAAIYVHTYPWGQTGLEVTKLLIRKGVDPAKIVICHIDVDIDERYIRQLLKRGVFVEFDNFGKEFYIDAVDRGGFCGGVFARDIERVHAICELLESGYERQLLITTDICLKSLLCHYGGWGYAHILKHIVPMLRDEGVPQKVIRVLLGENPRQLLDIRAG